MQLVVNHRLKSLYYRSKSNLCFVRSLIKRETDLRHNLSGFRVLEVGDKTMVQARSGKLLSTMEISVVALGCIVFVGACTTAICILCVRKSRR